MGIRCRKKKRIILNPVVGRGEVYGFWGAGQGATTRNGATAKGGAVPSIGRCDPAAGCGRHETRSRHPLRCPIPASRDPSCDAPGRPIPRSCNAAVPQKLCNSLRSGPHPEGESQIIRNIVINHNTDLLDERSTTGFRIIGETCRIYRSRERVRVSGAAWGRSSGDC